MKKLFLALICLCLAAGSASAARDRIVAVVNDAVITQSDLNARLSLVKRQLGNKEMTTAQEKTLSAKVLDSLVDEELYRQQATELNLQVLPDELAQAIRRIEKNNKMAAGSYDTFVKGLETTANAQLAADLLWQKVVARRIRPRVSVSDDEISLLLHNMATNAQVEEQEISHIFLAVEDSNMEGTAREMAASLHTRLQNGEDFTAMARAYSEDSSAEKGGYMGWFTSEELPEALKTTLATLLPGQVSEPVRSPSGWHILKLLDRRVTQAIDPSPIAEARLSGAMVALGGDKKLLTQAKRVNSAEKMMDFLREHGASAPVTQWEEESWRPLANLPTPLIEELEKAKAGDFIRLTENDTLYLVRVLEKRQRLPEKIKMLQERIGSRLLNTRLEMASRRYLRDLRRKSHIDIRL